MIICIPQNIDPYNTHLKSLVRAYSSAGIEMQTGVKMFLSDQIPDIIHFHFLEGLLKHLKYDEKYFFERLDYYKNNNVRFLLTIHDSRPHSKIKEIDFPKLYRRFSVYIDLYIHHGFSSIALLKEILPVSQLKKHIVCHHGDYLNEMAEFNYSVERAREMMKLPKDKKIILIFGQLQFKNTDFAQQVLEQVRIRHPEAILLMAGVFPRFRYNRLNMVYYKFNNGILRNFRFNKIVILKRFSQLETYLLFKASDVIFLPHKSGLTTGIIPMAATLSKPFVYPSIGVFEEQADYCYSEKYSCGNQAAASDAIDRILNSGKKSFDNSKWLENNNWDNHVGQILASL